MKLSIQRTTHTRTDVVVFLIGFRVNRLWALRSWVPVFLAMPRMLRELSTDPNAGFLGYRLLFGGRGATVVQYWTSVEALYTYANDTGRAHRPAWKRFNQQARRTPGVVGIWHETYRVPAGSGESIYVGMPPTGLAAATGVRSVGAGTETARERITEPVGAAGRSSGS